MSDDATIRYSIVIPLHDEEQNVRPLYDRLTRVLGGLGEPYEIVLVDDYSSDGTFDVLAALHEADPRVTVLRFTRNFGQTAALRAGFDFARGEVVVAMDGDLQDDPSDLPALVAKLDEGYDIVSGWRRDRKEPWLTRRVPSQVANWIISKICGVRLHDFGTTFKAYRREVLRAIDLHAESHRFIPALATRIGAAIAEVPVRNNPRASGRSHYGLERVPRVAVDLVRLKRLLGGRPLPDGGLAPYAIGTILDGAHDERGMERITHG